MTNSDRSDTMQGPTLVQKNNSDFINDEKQFLSVHTPSILINRRNWPGHCGKFVRIGTTVQSRAFQASSLAQHWAVSRRSDARGRRRAFATKRVLHRAGERRRLEDR